MQKIITHSPTRQPRDGDVVIQVTDMSVHTRDFSATPSVGKKIV